LGEGGGLGSGVVICDGAASECPAEGSHVICAAHDMLRVSRLTFGTCDIRTVVALLLYTRQTSQPHAISVDAARHTWLVTGLLCPEQMMLGS